MLEELIAERAKTHGDFGKSAKVAQDLKNVLRDTEHTKWDDLGSVHCEALDNIVQKIARILTGDPDHRDAWTDLQGYCQLVLDRITEGPETFLFRVMYEEGSYIHDTASWTQAENMAKGQSFVRPTRIQWMEHGVPKLRRYDQGKQLDA